MLSPVWLSCTAYIWRTCDCSFESSVMFCDVTAMYEPTHLKVQVSQVYATLSAAVLKDLSTLSLTPRQSLGTGAKKRDFPPLLMDVSLSP